MISHSHLSTLKMTTTMTNLWSISHSNMKISKIAMALDNMGIDLADMAY